MKNNNTGNVIFIKTFETYEEAAKYADLMNVSSAFQFFVWR